MALCLRGGVQRLTHKVSATAQAPRPLRTLRSHSTYLINRRLWIFRQHGGAAGSCIVRSWRQIERRNFATGGHKGQEIQFPALSPTMTTGKLVKWLIKEGDSFKPGDLMFEVETDKATVAFEVQEAGILAKILAPDDTPDVAVNTVVAYFVNPGEDWKNVAIEAKKESPKPAAATSTQAPAPAQPAKPTPRQHASPSSGHVLGSHHAHGQLLPSVRRLLEEYQISATDVKGSGRRGLLLKDDVVHYIKSKGLSPHRGSMPPYKAPSGDVAVQQKPPTARAAAAGAKGAPKFEDVPVTNMRQVIAKRLTESKTRVPHGYASRECTIDALMSLRKRLNAPLDAKISVNDFVIRASALALRDVPEANVSWNEAKQEVVQQPSIDISVAVALEAGLITPIIKKTDTKGLSQIGAEMKDLAARARVNTLQLHEFQGGSFSVSNLGMFGITEFSAVLNPPQAMILAVGGSKAKLVLNEKTGKPVPSSTMVVTLSYDARCVDEDIASRWLDAFEKYISTPERMLL